jgi:hypothetical protein
VVPDRGGAVSEGTRVLAQKEEEEAEKLEAKILSIEQEILKIEKKLHSLNSAVN